ncbi:hypothetical protein PIB30_017281 [Stylosanthes scabra]|uniref:Glycine-rich protein n=1 Tax=Stylosanthes scabra TaxID=79078 RepID=A0ABU6R7W4_9FABA|nr:hypothetical protein [Stylosanthes scabra]
MGCNKALFLLVLFVVTILVTSSEEAPRDLDEKFDQNYGNNNDLTQAVDESNQYRGGGGRGGYGGPRRGGGGWRGGYDGSPWGYGDGLSCPHGCCYMTDTGCVICCREANNNNNIDAKTRT